MMTREQIENAIKCCNPYDENCGDCPFNQYPQGRCFEVLAKTAFSTLLEDRERLQKQVKGYQDKIEHGTLVDTEEYFIVEENQWAGKNRFLVCQNAIQLAVCDFCENREEAEKRLKELQE